MIKKILPVLVSMLMLLSIVAGTSAAANTTTSNSTSYNISQISQSASNVKSYVDSNGNLPNNVKVGNTTVIPSQFLYLLTTATQNVGNNNNSSIKLRNVSSATNTSENVTSGTLNKTEYLKIANNINTFIKTNGRLPNYVKTSLGNMEYQSLIYTYSKIMTFYKENNRLPTTVSVQSWSNTIQTIYGPTGKLNGTSYPQTLLGSQSYGYVLKIGPYGNKTSPNKVAVVIGMYPQEEQSHIAFLNAITDLSSSLKNMQIWVYDIVVTKDDADYTLSREHGNDLAKLYVVPQITNSANKFKLLIDVHGNRGFYTTNGQIVKELVMVPTSTSNDWASVPMTPTSVYAKGVNYANYLIKSSYTGGLLQSYYIHSATSPPYLTLPVEAKGIPSLIFDFYLNIPNYAQVLYEHDVGVLKALNAMFA